MSPAPARRFPAIVGGVLGAPRAALADVAARGGAVNALLWLIALGTVCLRLGDLAQAALGVRTLPLQSVFVQLMVVVRQELLAPLPAVLLAAFALLVVAGRGRRDAGRAVELAAACAIPGLATAAVYRALDLLVGVPPSGHRLAQGAGAVWSFAVLVLAAIEVRSGPVDAAASTSTWRERAAAVALAVVLGMGFLGGTLFVARHLEELAPVGRGRPAPGFTLARIDGTPGAVSLADLRGKVILLDFWATWCPPCVAMLPKLHELHAEWQGRGVEIVGINADGPGSAADVQAFLGRHPSPYPVVADDGRTSERYGVTVLPRMVVVGRDGKIAHVIIGSSDKREVAEALARAAAP